VRTRDRSSPTLAAAARAVVRTGLDPVRDQVRGLSAGALVKPLRGRLPALRRRHRPGRRRHALRGCTATGQLRQDRTPPAQPRRRPPSQRRPLPCRAQPPALVPMPPASPTATTASDEDLPPARAGRWRRRPAAGRRRRRRGAPKRPRKVSIWAVVVVPGRFVGGRRRIPGRLVSRGPTGVGGRPAPTARPSILGRRRRAGQVALGARRRWAWRVWPYSTIVIGNPGVRNAGAGAVPGIMCRWVPADGGAAGRTVSSADRRGRRSTHSRWGDDPNPPRHVDGESPGRDAELMFGTVQVKRCPPGLVQARGCSLG
jgi:hypothetical protein